VEERPGSSTARGCWEAERDGARRGRSQEAHTSVCVQERAERDARDGEGEDAHVEHGDEVVVLGHDALDDVVLGQVLDHAQAHVVLQEHEAPQEPGPRDGQLVSCHVGT